MNYTHEKETREVITLLFSKLISASSSSTSPQFLHFKQQFAHFFKNFLDITEDKKNLQAFGSLSALLLADIELGMDVFLANMQPIVECLDIMDNTEGAQLLLSEIIAHATAHK